VPRYLGDAVELDGRGSAAKAVLHVGPATDVFKWGGEVGTAGAGERQLSFLAFDPAGPFYYCEVYDNGMGAEEVKFTYTYNGINYTFFDRKDLPGPIENGPLTLTLRHHPADMGCRSQWQAAVTDVAGTLPAGITPDRISVGAMNVQLRLEYVVQIRTE
jgi:hypothetical protein